MHEDKNSLAFRFQMRMLELIEASLADGTLDEDGWDPDALGFAVFGGDPLLGENPELVADIVGDQLRGSGITEGDLTAIMRGMEDRAASDEAIRDGWL